MFCTCEACLGKSSENCCQIVNAKHVYFPFFRTRDFVLLSMLELVENDEDCVFFFVKLHPAIGDWLLCLKCFYICT